MGRNMDSGLRVLMLDNLPLEVIEVDPKDPQMDSKIASYCLERQRQIEAEVDKVAKNTQRGHVVAYSVPFIKKDEFDAYFPKQP